MTQEVSGWGPAEDQLLLSLQHLLRPGPPPPAVGCLCLAVVAATLVALVS